MPPAALHFSGARACPRCHALVHAQKIDALSAQAQKREASGDIAGARELWSQALNLLPSDTTQAQWMRGHLAALPKPAHATPTWLKRLGPLGPFLLILLKGKGLFFAVFKLKFLFSLFTFVGVYWALYGWKFGVGFAASILIHEMGHYIDIKRRGLPAEMPVFLPGLGAYVKWQALGVSQAKRAQIALAGPLAGWLAAAICARALSPDTLHAVGRARPRRRRAQRPQPDSHLGARRRAGRQRARPHRETRTALRRSWIVVDRRRRTLPLHRCRSAVAALHHDAPLDAGPPEEEGWDTLLYYVAVMAALALTLHLIPGHGMGGR